MKRRRWPALLPFLVLAGISALLAGQVEKRLSAPPASIELSLAASETSAEPAAGEALPSRAALPDFGVPPGETYAVVVDRNLFAIDRRPPPRDDGDSQRTTVERRPLEATLAGVVLAGEQRFVILVDNKSQERLRLSPGDSFNGWRLAEVAANAATFTRGPQRRTLSMAFTSASGAGRSEGARAGGLATQNALRPDDATAASMRALRRARQGGLDRDPTRSLLYTQQRNAGGKPVRANRVPDVPDYDYPEPPAD